MRHTDGSVNLLSFPGFHAPFVIAGKKNHDNIIESLFGFYFSLAGHRNSIHMSDLYINTVQLCKIGLSNIWQQLVHNMSKLLSPQMML